MVLIDHYPVYIIKLRRRNDHYNLSSLLRFGFVTVVAVVVAAEFVAVVAVVAV